MAFEDRSTWTQARSAAEAVQIDEGLRAYMLRVYNYMASGILLTGIVSWLVANTEVKELFYTVGANGKMQQGMLMWIALFASLGMVFYLSFKVSSLKASTAQALFWLYAGLNGVWLSSIFLTYTGTSIVQVFFITSAAFAGLSLFGYTTKRNLDGLGSFMVMGLIGLLVASVVNIFLQSGMLSWIVSAVGVLVFSGLTAYDTQKIKEMYLEADGSETASKKAIMGALTLYLDFINLFLMLLRFFGQSRD